MDDVKKHLDAAYQELLAAQKLLNTQIRTYPAPISGCDAQFNHLLGERQRICRALSALTTEIFVPTSRDPMHVSEMTQQ